MIFSGDIEKIDEKEDYKVYNTVVYLYAQRILYSLIFIFQYLIIKIYKCLCTYIYHVIIGWKR